MKNKWFSVFDAISKDADEVVAELESGIVTERNLARAVECLQRQSDALGEMQDDLPELAEKEVVIKIDGKTIRFPDVDKFSDFAASLHTSPRSMFTKETK
jgi:hypothetical protein